MIYCDEMFTTYCKRSSQCFVEISLLTDENRCMTVSCFGDATTNLMDHDVRFNGIVEEANLVKNS